MRAMKKIVILISGRGSNMEAIVRAARSEQWPAKIAAVISHRADAEGLVFATEQGIATRVISSKDYPAGVKVHGATVHFVTPTLDHGPIVAQAAVPVLPNDTEQTLSERVLEQEHIIYPRAVRLFIEGRLSLDNGIVRDIDPVQ
jgi:folate-dependent phosphoribosylglycinamide formyltransferase PurN